MVIKNVVQREMGDILSQLARGGDCELDISKYTVYLYEIFKNKKRKTKTIKFTKEL